MSSTANRLHDLSMKEKRAVLARLVSEQGQKPRTFPLSYAQERLWFLDQLAPGSTLFNIDTAIRLTFAVDNGALERSINEIVRRHESLRTTFIAVDGTPAQVVAPSLTVQMPVLDLGNLPATEREQEANRLANEEASRRFDLTQGPLIRIKLLRLGTAESLFLLTLHHIVADGWSLGIFFRELAELYAAFSAGRPSPLVEPSFQYADFALWQRAWLKGEVLDQQLDYWKAQLENIPVLQLPTDRSRPPVQTHRGAYCSIAVSKHLTESLQALSQREGTTLFMTLLAGFTALLSRYSGQDDVVVGTYIANRHRREVEELIGFFVNTLVLRTKLDGDPNVLQLLSRVRETALGAYAHQDLPFPKLVEELQPERDLSRNPYFQVVLQLVNTPTLSQSGESASQPPVQVERTTSVLDLVVSYWETPEGLRGHVEYNTDLFEAATIERMIDHYLTLLEGLTGDPDQRLSALPLMTEQERRKVLVEWNSTDQAYPQEQNIPQHFENQVARTPTRIALVCNGEHLTFEELNVRSNRLAHYLRDLGVGRESLVGVCLGRSINVVVALMGIFKAGGAYLPLDPTYPSERLSFMLEDSKASHLITNRRTAPQFSNCSGTMINLDEDVLANGAQFDANPTCDLGPDDLAYAIYTSGSTGRPKGVAVNHRQLLNRFAWMWDDYPFAPDEVACQKTALGFVDSLWELFGGLLKGIPTVILPDEVVQDPKALVDALAEHKVSRIWLVPSLLRVILDTYPDLQQRLPSLQFWVTSGEDLQAELFRRFRHSMPQSTLYNLYGTSEVWDATWYDPERETANDADWRVPIGRPIANMRAYALDAKLQPVPIGVPGELCVGGVGVGRGYIGRPDLTAEQFPRDPFRPEDDARLYRTGDLVRFRADGNLEFLGRRDHQVKLRGFRVEPGEVESTLNQHPGVKESAVVAREDSPGKLRLVAYVVTKAESPVEPDGWQRFLREQLPLYLVPATFVSIDALPLTPSGKVDRRSLPAPNSDRPALENPFVAPRTPVEDLLAGIWAEVLGLDAVGVHDDFFGQLGGHSLLATQVVARASSSLEVDIPVRLFFEAPTVAEFATALLGNPSTKERIEKTAQLLLTLSQLSDDEVQAMLASRAGRAEAEE
jgi:amino acid adenylation domain-containing protein